MLIMAKQFHGGGKSAMGAKKQQKSDVNAAFHPHLQKESTEPTQTTHCKEKKSNQKRLYLVWVEIHIQGLNTHHFLTQQMNRNIYSEQAKDNNCAPKKLTTAWGQ